MANGNPVSEIANLFGGGASSLGGEIASIAGVLRALQTDEENAMAAGAASAKSSSASSIGSTVLGAVENVFGAGIGPLVSGLVGLFGGGGSSEPLPALAPYVAPPSVNVNAGISGSVSGVFATDNAAGGAARPVPAATNVTVQVQALDSQSFLDHSQDIAMAVRQAMLESSTLNDVIREVSA
ncbi:MAG: hypothetical protein LAO79_13585 [Acidobacteriia bacterium]|nr:hypothetical protein [Terriglobia bacterium]